MRIGIFYFTTDAELANQREEYTPICVGYAPPIGWVRCEVVEGNDLCDDGLDKANPRAGENVMNSHEVR